MIRHAAIDRDRADRVWLLHEKSAEDVWHAAREILILRRLIVANDGAWIWHPDQLFLRDYYANSLLPFPAVKQRGWPERRAASGEQRAGQLQPSR